MSKNSDNSESDKVRKVKSKTDVKFGEQLQICTDGEWDASDEPYSAELLNVKKKPNRVNVFTATDKPRDTLNNNESFILPVKRNTLFWRVLHEKYLLYFIVEGEVREFHGLARLIHKTCEIYLTNPISAELHVNIKFPDWRNEK